MDSILSVRHLSTGYGKKQVLFDVSLDVIRGEALVVTGGNGSGKSTLLKAAYGMLPPWTGEARIQFRPEAEGTAISTSIVNRNLENGLAYLPQKHAVFDDLTVEDNLRLAGQAIRGKEEFSFRRDEVLALAPILRPMLRRKPERMSGGERQIMALAMLLLHRPKLMLLDEPLAGLDRGNLDLVLGLLRELHARGELTLVLVEHRVADLASLAQRTVHLRLGTILESN